MENYSIRNRVACSKTAKVSLTYCYELDIKANKYFSYTITASDEDLAVAVSVWANSLGVRVQDLKPYKETLGLQHPVYTNLVFTTLSCRANVLLGEA